MEFEAFGVSRAERAGRLEEGIELIRKIWTEDRVTFKGKYFQVTDLPAGTRPCSEADSSNLVCCPCRPSDATSGTLGGWGDFKSACIRQKRFGDSSTFIRRL